MSMAFPCAVWKQGIGLIRLGSLIASTLALTGCSDPDRKRGDILDVREFSSPDGHYVCVVYGETFYNTTGYDRHIYLRRAGETYGYPGNVYVLPVGDGVKVSWTSPTNLLVELKFETRRKVPAGTNVAGVMVAFSEVFRFPE